MLYGILPWDAKTTYQFYKNAEIQPLTFPDSPQVDARLKDLLREMLKYDQKDRISWDQVVINPLIRHESQNNDINNFFQSSLFIDKKEIPTSSTMIKLQSNLILGGLQDNHIDHIYKKDEEELTQSESKLIRQKIIGVNNFKQINQHYVYIQQFISEMEYNIQ